MIFEGLVFSSSDLSLISFGFQRDNLIKQHEARIMQLEASLARRIREVVRTTPLINNVQLTLIFRSHRSEAQGTISKMKLSGTSPHPDPGTHRIPVHCHARKIRLS